MLRLILRILPMLLLGVAPLGATTYFVGSCSSGSYSSITAAVQDPKVVAGDIINICPGTYIEQVIISKALTLQGVRVNGSNRVVIVPPSDALQTVSLFLPGSPALRPGVWITSGPVTINNVMSVTSTTPSCPPLWNLLPVVFHFCTERTSPPT